MPSAFAARATFLSTAAFEALSGFISTATRNRFRSKPLKRRRRIVVSVFSVRFGQCQSCLRQRCAISTVTTVPITQLIAVAPRNPVESISTPLASNPTGKP